MYGETCNKAYGLHSKQHTADSTYEGVRTERRVIQQSILRLGLECTFGD